MLKRLLAVVVSQAGGSLVGELALLEDQGWRDGKACTTSELRGFLRGPCTGGGSVTYFTGPR